MVRERPGPQPRPWSSPCSSSAGLRTFPLLCLLPAALLQGVPGQQVLELVDGLSHILAAELGDEFRHTTTVVLCVFRQARPDGFFMTLVKPAAFPSEDETWPAGVCAMLGHLATLA